MKHVRTDYGFFNYFNNDSIGSHISGNQFWDPCLRPFMDRLKPGDVFVDVGANLGFFPVYLAKRGVVCHAFEPSPEVYNLMLMNLGDNQLTEEQVHTYNVALYDKETELTAMENVPYQLKFTSGHFDYENSNCTGWLCLKAGGGSLQNFPARTLDSYNLGKVDLLKIDTQGCDLRVLHGAKETIQQRPVILFEFEKEMSIVHGDIWERYEQFFSDLHYDIKKLGSVEWIGTPQ